MIHTEYGHSISFIAQNWDKNPNFVHSDLRTIGEPNGKNLPAFSNSDPSLGHLDRNTWESWHLIPQSRPTLPPPSRKSKELSDVFGINGDIDLALKTIPYPLFKNRTGSFTFIYNPLFQKMHNGYKPWDVLYSEICEYIHGRHLRMVLEDDPSYYYEGIFYVENWDSSTDGSGSIVTIGYSVQPYKMSLCTSLDDWLWDPFNFYNGAITSNVFDFDVSNLTSNDYSTNKGNFQLSKFCGPDGTAGSRLNLFGLVGTKPQIPIIHWSPNNYNENNTVQDKHKRSLIVNYVNSAFGIDYTKSGIMYKYFDPIGSYGQGNSISSSGVALIGSDNSSPLFPEFTFKDNDMIFCDNYMGEDQYIQFIGDGAIQIEFRRGSL